MTRDQVFTSLHEAHARAWDRAPDGTTLTSRGTGTHLYMRFYAWRMAWWYELERAFPEKIKKGIICHSPPLVIFPQDMSANVRTT